VPVFLNCVTAVIHLASIVSYALTRRWPYLVMVMHTIWYISISISAALAHPEVQFHLHHPIGIYSMLGETPTCHVRYEYDASRCTMCDSSITTMFLQAASSYVVTFVLTFKPAVIGSIICVAVYSSIVLPSQVQERRAYDEICILIGGIVTSLSAKLAMQLSQRKLYMDLRAKHQEVVKEKVLRCQAEFHA